MTLPSWAPAWLTARESGDPAVLLLTASHPEWGAAYRLARNTADVTSRGEVFRAAMFAADVVTDSDGPPRATLTIPNVDREIGQMVLRLSSPPQITLEVVALSAPDEPIYRAARLELRNVSIDALAVSGDLASHDYSSEPCGRVRVIPGRFPALFLVR
jgi:hypothetical protein